MRKFVSVLCCYGLMFFNINNVLSSVVYLQKAPPFGIYGPNAKPRTVTPAEVSQERSAREIERARKLSPSITKIDRLLKQQNVPFEASLLFTSNWKSKLAKTLQEMPQMKQDIVDKDKIRGAILGNTLNLTNKVIIEDDTVIIVNNIVVKGASLEFKGNHDFHLFVMGKMTDEAGNTVALKVSTSGTGYKDWLEENKVKEKKISLNVPINQGLGIRSSQISKILPNSTFLFNSPFIGTTAKRSAFSDLAFLNSFPLKSLFLSVSNYQSTSGGPGSPGNTGVTGNPGINGSPDPGATGSNGVCGSNVNGGTGGTGGGGKSGKTGGIGGDGGDGNNATNQTITVTLNQSVTASANGGEGGPGGQGGTGGRGGDGGKGGPGGPGAGCACQAGYLGNGGPGGVGGYSGRGGDGGPGGVGGKGGNGAIITIIHPAGYNTNQVNATAHKGQPGAKGLPGIPNFPGTPGAGGEPGPKGSLNYCSISALDGATGPAGSSSDSGEAGEYGEQKGPGDSDGSVVFQPENNNPPPPPPGGGGGGENGPYLEPWGSSGGCNEYYWVYTTCYGSGSCFITGYSYAGCW